MHESFFSLFSFLSFFSLLFASAVALLPKFPTLASSVSATACLWEGL